MTTGAIGAILVGGRSSRMEADKALLEVAGVAMVHRVATALTAAGLEVVTVGGPHRIPEYPNIADAPQLQGPLAGLSAALDYSRGRPVMLVAVDQPLLSPATVEQLVSIRTHDAVVPMAGGHPQVACSVYRPTCRQAIRSVASVNPTAALRDLLPFLSVRYVEPDEWEQWGEDGSSWRSVDTPQDLAAIESDLGS